METGPVRIGDDWVGLFIRGDETMHFAMRLGQLIAAYQSAESQNELQRFDTTVMIAAVVHLRELMGLCAEPVTRPVVRVPGGNEVEVLHGLVRELADDLEAELRERYSVPVGEEPHPANKLRFERDMGPINKARRVLA